MTVKASFVSGWTPKGFVVIALEMRMEGMPMHGGVDGPVSAGEWRRLYPTPTVTHVCISEIRVVTDSRGQLYANVLFTSPPMLLR